MWSPGADRRRSAARIPFHVVAWARRPDAERPPSPQRRAGAGPHRNADNSGVTWGSGGRRAARGSDKQPISRLSPQPPTRHEGGLLWPVPNASELPEPLYETWRRQQPRQLTASGVA